MDRLLLLAIWLTACSAQPLREQSYAVIEVATEAGCDRPGVRLDDIEQLDGMQEVEILDRFAPVRVDPGRYAIAVACQNPFDKAKNECVYWGHPNEYPTYSMEVKANVRYSFRCFDVGGDLVYRISESRP